ncbi:MAG: hypothetical protein CM15mV81_290 [uncultured marine virus]|nr:MAG: hypothetical protein CM15mV81_290 [uncultured marine virus]
MAKTPLWQRKGRKEPKGGLNAAGRASARKQGMNLKAPVKSGRQSSKGKLLAKRGKHERAGKETQGKTNETSSSLSMGSK